MRREGKKDKDGNRRTPRIMKNKQPLPEHKKNRKKQTVYRENYNKPRQRQTRKEEPTGATRQ
ncbi:hypothetical protein [Bacteroides graminisolvens]|uniref:hypothetical protein n=1 Tax=Bacteroides graminisolvens TaxID=477666 RepID=UPI00054DAEE5|nr:hypothetical protein [Bacteroides graminisolvens]